MSRITQDSGVDRFAAWPEASRYVSQFLAQVTTMLNGGLLLADNFDGKILTLSFSSGQTDHALAHGLGRVPTGYVVIRRSANMTVYDGATAWTSHLVYLQSTAAGGITVFVF